VATTAVLIGGGWAVVTYVTTRTDAAKIASIEAKKPLLQKRMDTCLDAVTTAYNVTHEKDTRKENIAEFEKIYWGPFLIVANQDMISPATEFMNCAKDATCNPGRLDSLQVALAAGCRKSIGYDWDVLPPGTPGGLTTAVK
jgi:hypothetical protein